MHALGSPVWLYRRYVASLPDTLQSPLVADATSLIIQARGNLLD